MRKCMKWLGGIVALILMLLAVNVFTEAPVLVKNQTVTTQKKNKKDNKKDNNKKQEQKAQSNNLGDLLSALLDGETLETEAAETETEVEEIEYHFRSWKYLSQHFEKHGGEFDYANEEEYEKGASKVANNPKALHKIEKEDGDDIYYLEDTNEFVVVSKDGYLRTYFKPSAGKKYYDRQ